MPKLILLALLAGFPALSTDMYLPAIPTLQQVWGIPLSLANISLVAYFAAFSVFLLVLGPLSDRVGRKPVLLGSIALFMAGCLLCAVSPGITWLICARIVQAAGAAGASALALALTKDLYEGSERHRILGYIGVIVSVCPMLAPTLGGLLLELASWRWIFVSQAALACMALYGSITLEEPGFEKTRGGVLAVAGRYLRLMRNWRFVFLTLSMSFIPLSFFAFIGGSADIYITGFGVSRQAFGLFFGLNALAMMAGSYASTRLVNACTSHRLLAYCLLGLTAGSLLMLYGGGSTPAMVAGPMFCMSFFTGISRPLSNNMILETVDSDVGAASAVLTFFLFMFAATAMETISLDWQSKPMLLACLGLLGAGVPTAGLLFLRFRGIRI